MFELQEVRAIHCHPELIVSAHDFHLKGLALSEGEVVVSSLLFAPFIANQTVPHNNFLAMVIKARVNVHGNVIPFGQVQCEHFGIVVNCPDNGDDHLVIASVWQVLNIWHFQ